MSSFSTKHKNLLCLRFDTCFHGHYFEIYYIFVKLLKRDKVVPKIVAHTLPSFLPLEEWERECLSSDLQVMRFRPCFPSRHSRSAFLFISTVSSPDASSARRCRQRIPRWNWPLRWDTRTFRSLSSIFAFNSRIPLIRAVRTAWSRRWARLRSRFRVLLASRSVFYHNTSRISNIAICWKCCPIGFCSVFFIQSMSKAMEPWNKMNPWTLVPMNPLEQTSSQSINQLIN